MDKPEVKVAPETVAYQREPAKAKVEIDYGSFDLRCGSSDKGPMIYNGHDRSPGKFYGGSENPVSNSASFRLNYDGKLYATQMFSKAFFYTSDARDKEEVAPLHGALHIVDQLRGVAFRWRENGELDAGVIAQQVQEHIPVAVYSEEDRLAVKPSVLIGYLIEAVRELKAEVDALKGGK